MADELSGEELFRNVAPGFYDQDADEPGAACLWPDQRDGGYLSTDRASIWSAEQSFLHRTTKLALESKGVITVAVDDLIKHGCTPTIADPLTAGVDGQEYDNPAHALTDFSAVKALSKKDRGAVREALFASVFDGTWAYQP